MSKIFSRCVFAFRYFFWLVCRNQYFLYFCPIRINRCRSDVAQNGQYFLRSQKPGRPQLRAAAQRIYMMHNTKITPLQMEILPLHMKSATMIQQLRFSFQPHRGALRDTQPSKTGSPLALLLIFLFGDNSVRDSRKKRPVPLDANKKSRLKTRRLFFCFIVF